MSRAPAALTNILMGGVLLLMLTGVAVGGALYLIPGEPLDVPELQPAVRVEREANFAVGDSRTVRWGDRIILVVRRRADRYYAVQGTSPYDDCLLQWDVNALRIVSPCTYLVYDLHGDVVAGLTRAPLNRYAVFVRGGVVYVTEPPG